MQPPPKATLMGIATAGQAVGFSVTLFLLLSGQALGYSVTLFLLVSFSPSFLLYLVTDLASSAPKTTEMVFCRAGAPCQEIPPPHRRGCRAPAFQGPFGYFLQEVFPHNHPSSPHHKLEKRLWPVVWMSLDTDVQSFLSLPAATKYRGCLKLRFHCLQQVTE